MPKVFPEPEKRRVRELHAEGRSNADIARQMATEYPENWSSKYAHRTVSRLLKENEIQVDRLEQKTLDEMSRDERFRFIENRLETSPRFKMLSNQLILLLK